MNLVDIHKSAHLNGFDRVYIITGDQVLGKMTYVRLPRKEKKRRKKSGTFEPPKFVGFDLSKILKS